ncbi:sensor domain-containing protein [Candidatus Leptofilum sp.]|uniref:sensor domain-containing protein n=1 Tax=Candidatus Leptofilum sp. TaxID=3241576 RepID=UPI003B5B951F
MKSSTSQLADHFAILGEKQTYFNLIYLLLAFPLGIAYFVISVTGLSLGIGLLIIWVGLFVLLALFAGWWGLAAMERLLAIHLLGEEIAPMNSPISNKGNLWERTKAHFTDAVTWKSALYLLLKFPVGIASFVVTITAVSVCGTLIFAPFIYQTGNISVFAWRIDTLFEALLATGFGLLITPYAIQLLNKAAELSGQFARFMLSNGEPVIKEKGPEDLINMMV